MATDSTGIPSGSSADTKPSDPTFRRYTQDQAKVYASQRLSYPSELYEAVLAYHSSTGGQFDLLVDVGCGPGNATRDVARSFDRALGVDPGEAMIETARGLGGKTRADEDIGFVAGAAEELLGVPGVQEERVDLVTAAMAVGGVSYSTSFSVASI
jgi:ubiquinone/menaquinone biosynthesis C-methylase UbiE